MGVAENFMPAVSPSASAGLNGAHAFFITGGTMGANRYDGIDEYAVYVGTVGKVD